MPADKSWVKPGALCWYHPILGDTELRFAGVVREEPWPLGHGALCTHVHQMSQAYQDWRGAGKTTVYGALLEALEPRDP